MGSGLFGTVNINIGGMNAQSRAIGHVSDNLANSRTTGFKRVDTHFREMVSDDQVANPMGNNGKAGGANATPVYRNALQGTLLQSQASTDMSISGRGFFTVQRGTIDSTGVLTLTGSQLYTRRGDFTLSQGTATAGGFMVNGSGYYLMGYPISSSTGLPDTSAAVPIEVVPLTTSAVATTTIDYAANLPAGTDIGDTLPTSTITIYDSTGAAHEIELTWTKEAGVNEWSLAIESADATSPLDRTLIFDFSGPPAGTIATITAGTGTGPALTPVAPVAPDNTLSATTTLGFTGAAAQTLTFNFGTLGQAIGVTQYADTSFQVTSVEQNGIPLGAFRSLDIDDSGYVVLNYSNGLSRRAYQVPLALFNAPQLLQREIGSAFSATLEAGDATLTAAGTDGAGVILGNTLEASNVDIASEFTKMVEAQRIYSANARALTASNAMLEGLSTLSG